MKVLVIGSGGREHALAWRLAKSGSVDQVFVAPGNAGTAMDPTLTNVAVSEPQALVDFARDNDIALTVVGPEAPLAAGVVNLFRANGLTIFGPTREAAQLESSKDFAKSFMKRKGIPTADYETFSDPEAAHDYIRRKGAPIVIKADGLAAGKGVVVAQTKEEALEALDQIMGGVFGAVSFYDAVTGASAMTGALFQVSPVNTFILCVGMRVLMGLCVGLVFNGLKRFDKPGTWSYIVSAMCAPGLNTLFFMGYIVLAFYGCDYIQNIVAAKGAANPFMFVVLLVGVQGMMEFLVSGILGGIVARAVAKFLK